MLTAAYEKFDGNYGRWAAIREIDAKTLSRAICVFDDYKARGVILNDCFDDTSWRLFDQTKNVGLTFSFDDNAHEDYIEWIGCDYGCFQDCVKAYITFNLGKIALSTLRELSKALTALANMTGAEAAAPKEYVNHITEFLQIIPGACEERDYIIEEMEEHAVRRLNKHKGKQRRLSDFDAYLKFDEVLSRLWLTADKRQKLFYFPLYFWWNLTAILPLRPTEFLLTPRDCLHENGNGENIITVRRTKLKGRADKIAYRVADDYEKKQYVISGHLAGEVHEYLNATVNMRHTKIGTLFLQQPHFNYLGISQKPTNQYYSYSCLKTCLRYFHDETDAVNIARIKFGDTRHIAMANLILSGGSPVICRELAGHSDIDISSHYYSNISNLVECATIARYRKSKSGDAEMAGTSKYPLTLPTVRSRVSGGWCGSPEMARGEISDCLKVTGEHIGDCSRCIYYFPDNQGVRIDFLDVAAGKKKVDADSQYLIRMIELVRKGLGHEEDIKAALLRLQRSSHHYGRCLFEKYSTGDNIYGKT